MQTRKQLAFLPIALLALLVAACGGGSGGGQHPATATPGTPATLEGTAKEFADLQAQGLTATFKVTYATAAPESGQGDTFVVYNKPPMTRIDIIPAGSSTAASTLIGGNKTTRTISCSAESTTWKCSQIRPLGDSLLTASRPFANLTAEDLAAYRVTETASQSFAGQQARCFKLEPITSGDQALDYCFNQDGVPLYGAPIFGVVTASEYSTEVTSNDFVPPVEP